MRRFKWIAWVVLCVVSVALAILPTHWLVAKRVNLDEYNVRFYWVPADALPRILTISSSSPETPPEYYII